MARVLTAHSLTHNASSSGVEVLFQNAFSQKRSGDVLYALQPTWVPALKDREDNYARYSKRNKVPLYLYRSRNFDQFTCGMSDDLCFAAALQDFEYSGSLYGSEVRFAESLKSLALYFFIPDFFNSPVINFQYCEFMFMINNFFVFFG